NALFWCVNQEERGGSNRLYRSGELAPVTGKTITWTESGAGAKKVAFPITSDVVEMDRRGVWETDTGLRGASHLLSREETDLRSRGEGQEGDHAYFATSNRFAGNLKLWLLAAVAMVLLLESWLFHRHAVY
ncbi:MAG: hypothetical protein QE273_08225, partial [Verrucomicrobiales bacterium]|nr:hypothetical protein [Verrucomicrobiales bacterium]